MSVAAAVVLAAGASSRMGQPKPLVLWRDRPFVSHCIDRAIEVGAEPVVVVQGAWPLRDAVGSTAMLVQHDGWRDGPLSSLQAALRRLPEDRYVLVLTVDRPHIQSSTLASLMDAANREPTFVWQAGHGGKRGHPIIYPPDVVQELLALHPTETARAVLARPHIEDRRRTLDVDDAAVLDNLDRPQDLAALPI